MSIPVTGPSRSQLTAGPHFSPLLPFTRWPDLDGTPRGNDRALDGVAAIARAAQCLPQVRGLFVPVFAEVRSHDIVDHWYHELGDPMRVSEYCEVVADGLEPGAHSIFLAAAEGDRRYPSIDRLKGTLISAFLFPAWIVYLLLAEPVTTQACRRSATWARARLRRGSTREVKAGQGVTCRTSVREGEWRQLGDA